MSALVVSDPQFNDNIRARDKIQENSSSKPSRKQKPFRFEESPGPKPPQTGGSVATRLDLSFLFCLFSSFGPGRLSDLPAVGPNYANLRLRAADLVKDLGVYVSVVIPRDGKACGPISPKGFESGPLAPKGLVLVENLDELRYEGPKETTPSGPVGVLRSGASRKPKARPSEGPRLARP
ncbi:hypothetical protein GUJ93_ZPchr0013g36599 [Zizania palustris]|uniref:Uncharacterized protein n=1 Tax=Zizania palustris TaxID=103762 RepID=A0A8J6C033_ZIZPA|nr:hypothetical protein GUJ93_ZPchr0013g36599 [Zizania palustris]